MKPLTSDIEPTLSLSDAGAGRWDVIVIGAGPSGSAAAQVLALEGRRVLLVDRSRFPRSKVCGCCLSRAAVEMLATLGLSDLSGRFGANRLETLILAGPRGRASIPLEGGVALSRSTLDAALIRQAIHAGADFLPATPAVIGPSGPGCRHVELGRGDRHVSLEARVVVAAAGLGGSCFADREQWGVRVSPASRLGVGLILPSDVQGYRPGCVHIICGRDGYVGLVRLEDGRLDVAAALDPEAMRQTRDPGVIVRTILGESGMSVVESGGTDRWQGTPHLTRRRHRLGGERVFVIGDAAGYVEPFTGEGITWALASALAVAPFVAYGTRAWDPSLMRAWTKEHRARFAGRRRACRVIAEGLRRPWLTNALIAVLERTSRPARPVVRYVNSDLGRRTSQSARALGEISWT